MSNEKQSNSIQEQPTAETETTKENLLKKGLSRVGGGFSKLANFVGEKIDTAKDKLEYHKLWKEEFKKQAVKFYVHTPPITLDTLKAVKEIRVLKNSDQRYILALKSENLSLHQVLIGDKGQAFELIDIDTKPILFPNESSEYPIECVKFHYQPYTAPTPTTVQHINNNQNVNIAGDNQGDITLVADFSSQLSEIENAINEYRPSLLNKKKKDEALKLYGKFENCVVNRQKDQTLFDKFIEALKVVAPAAASIAATIIAAI